MSDDEVASEEVTPSPQDPAEAEEEGSGSSKKWVLIILGALVVLALVMIAGAMSNDSIDVSGLSA